MNRKGRPKETTKYEPEDFLPFITAEAKTVTAIARDFNRAKKTNVSWNTVKKTLERLKSPDVEHRQVGRYHIYRFIKL